MELVNDMPSPLCVWYWSLEKSVGSCFQYLVLHFRQIFAQNDTHPEKKSETTPQTHGKIIKNWECLGTLHARHPYEYTHAEPHDNQVLAMLVL